MAPRLDLAASVGCDGVEPDNVDCFLNSDCLGMSTKSNERKIELASVSFFQREFLRIRARIFRMCCCVCWLAAVLPPKRLTAPLYIARVCVV